VKLLAEHRTEVAALTSTNTGIELMPPLGSSASYHGLTLSPA